MTAIRTEKDSLGDYPVPAGALYGIHTQRAMENTAMAGRPVHAGLIRAYGTVKLACVQAIHEAGRWDARTYAAIVEACNEMREGLLDSHIRVDALQGGAGTSTNMNVNEVLANRALQILGHPPGAYSILHPVLDLNCYQSTNDTYPTALRVAAITGIRTLEQAVIALQEAFEDREKAFADVVKVGRTEMQDAVLTTMGRSMSAFAEAFSRDRWRLYKCEERLRVVNLGGTAIGTGIGAPRDYIFRVTDILRTLTGFGLARAENLVEATQNTDSFVEVSGILKACATNLLKSASDIRLMASGPDAGFGELTLPALQTGSSIMPGKINPVIPEAVTQAAIRVVANDLALTQAASLGNLELNAFIPLIADSLLESLSLLTAACDRFARLCVRGLKVNADRCARHTSGSIATATALVAPLGYRQAEAVLAESRATGLPIGEILETRGLMSREDFETLITPESVTRLGSPPSPGGTGSTPSAEHRHAEHKPPFRLWQHDCGDTQMRDASEEKSAYEVVNPVRKGLVNAPAEWPYQGERNVLRW